MICEINGYYVISVYFEIIAATAAFLSYVTLCDKWREIESIDSCLKHCVCVINLLGSGQRVLDYLT